MVEERSIKVSFSITGEFAIHDYGDDYITFKNGDEMKRYDKKQAIKFIEKAIERDGIEHWNLNISTKSREVEQTESTPVKERIGDNEKPF